MARNTRGSNSERFKYGICLNDECQKCKDKEIQQIPMRKEFVCSECGKELRECPPPKKSNKKLPIIIAAAVVVIGGVIGGVLALGGKDDSVAELTIDTVAEEPAVPALPDTIVVTDTVVEKDTIVSANTTTITEKTSTKTVVNTTSTQPKASSGSGSLSLSYGKYSGATKKGYAHGQGRLTYSTSRVINRNDPKQRRAEAGDYVIGEFFNGFVVYGKHYNAAGELIESLNFGVGSEDSYESK